MNARRDDDSQLSALDADPLASVRGHGSALADLAFGSLSRTAIVGASQGRNLAFLPNDALELDLTDPAQRHFGNYELLELIGEGGMGVVYRARQASLDRDVAVKLLAAGPWASMEFVERFRREAQNAARMQHPNIVAIYEVGSAEELHFFSMRLINGPSLAAVVKREGRLPAAHAAVLMRTIAEAVDYAHRLGVLHLDLKPANVLVDENGTPHVADFGLARRLDSALVADNDEVSGTPSYMAPEQATARTQKITPATDIWGLGAILYELVTGTPPFLGDSPHATLKLVVEGALRNPRHYAPNLPRDLEAIILKCMARNTAERYATARALADDLGRFIEHRAVGARPLSAPQRLLRWGKREPRLAATALLALAALLIGLAATTQQWRRADGNAKLAAANAALANEKTWQARIDQAAVAVRDGHSYDALPGLAANIREREAQGLDAHEDRIRIGAVERSAPRLIDAIAMGSGIYGIALSPDGASLAVATEDEKLRLIDIATGKERWQTSFNGATHFFVETGDKIRLEVLRFSADGNYLIGRNHVGHPEIVTPTGFDEVLFDASNGKVLTPPMQSLPNFRDATYSPDGAYAIVRSRDQHATLMRTADWQPIGTPYDFDKANPAWLVTTNARHVLTSGAGFRKLNIHNPRTLAIEHVIASEPNRRFTTWVSSPDGETIIVGHLDGQIERIDCRSGRRESISPSPVGRIGRVTFSPDGRWFGATADTGEVLVWDSATGKLAAPLMHLNTTPEIHRDQLFIDAAARMVIASVDMEMGLWYLPDAISAPVRLSGEFPNASAWWMRAFAYDPARGLIASDGGQGELLLWRVQQLAPRGLRSAPVPPGQLHVDTDKIVAVDGESVRVFGAAAGQPLGPELKLPQAASFAELTADDKNLVAVAGHEIFVYDAEKWTLRHAPIELPNDPARLTLSPDSRHALVLFADYADGKNRELGQTWDLVDGTANASAVAFEPSTRFRFSADGRGLLLWERDHLQWLDAMTLKPRWPPVELRKRLAAATVANEQAAVTSVPISIADAQISIDGSRIEVLTANRDTYDGPSRLWQFDSTTGAELKHALLRETGGGENFAMMPDQSSVIVQRADLFPPLWWDEMHGSKELPAYGSNEMGALALAPDATMFARAPRQDRIVLTSTHSLQWLTPTLPTALAAPNTDMGSQHPTHLAFTRDGNGLIGRARQHEWLYWDVRPDPRPVDLIAREAALLNPDSTTVKNGFSSMLADSERQALRSDDPGPPLYTGRFPAPPTLSRQPGLPAQLVDLSGFYNTPLSGMASEGYRSSYHELAPGVHRFLGTDFDVRGIIALSMQGFAAVLNPNRPPPRAIRGIRLGVDRVAAVNLLITSYDGLYVNEERPFTIVELDYRDGSRQRIPLIYLRDIMPTNVDDAGKPGESSPRIAWRAIDFGTPRGSAWISQICAVRLVNPHPEREVASLAVEATDEPDSTPLVFAITVEPVDAINASPVPVSTEQNSKRP